MGVRCIKYLLCAINSLIVVAWIMVIFFAARTKVRFEDFYYLFVPINYYLLPATLFNIVGVLIIVIAVFGCYGAIKESTRMVLVFTVCLSIVLMLEVTVAILSYTIQDEIDNYLARRIGNSMNDYESIQSAQITLDNLHTIRRCCGLEDADDFVSILYNKGAYPYPVSCCAYINEIVMGNSETDCGRAYERSCVDRLVTEVHRIDQNTLDFGTIALVTSPIQLTGMMFGCALGRAIRVQKTYRERQQLDIRPSLVVGYRPV